MQDRVGEQFDALILNPTKYGLFVELTDLFVEGLVPIDSLRGDRYTFRDYSHDIVGDHSGRTYRAGERVQVILDRILHQERRLQFSLVEEELPLTGKRTPKPPKKPGKAKRSEAAKKKKLKPPKHPGRKGKGKRR
jgi:ribonuclease R